MQPTVYVRCRNRTCPVPREKHACELAHRSPRERSAPAMWPIRDGLPCPCGLLAGQDILSLQASNTCWLVSPSLVGPLTLFDQDEGIFASFTNACFLAAGGLKFTPMG